MPLSKHPPKVSKFYFWYLAYAAVKGTFYLEDVDKMVKSGSFLQRQLMIVNYRVKRFVRKSKLYIPSTLNIALLQWHTHLNVCAVK